MNRPLRISLLAAAAVVVAGVVGIGVTLATFDPNSLKPRMIEAVRRATGRDLTIGGDIRLRPSLWPTFELSDVTLSNPPGFSRPQLATLKQMQLSLSLLPLLSREVQISSLTLVAPDILLERNAAGQANWQLAPQAGMPQAGVPQAGMPQAGMPQAGMPQAGGQSSQSAPISPARPSAPPKRLLLDVAAVNIENGTLGFRDDATGATDSVGVVSLSATSANADAPLQLDARLTHNGTDMAVAGETGSLARLQDPTQTTPWPVKVSVTAGTAKLTAEGALTNPLLGQGYKLNVTGAVPNTDDLALLLPIPRLPSVHDVTFAFAVAESDKGTPTISALNLRAGAGTLGGGVTLSQLQLTSRAMDQPIKLDMAATFNGSPLTATGTIGSPLQVPVPFDLTMRLLDELLTAKGNLAPVPGGFDHGASVQGLSLTFPPLDLSGDASVTLVPRLAVAGTLNATRVDADGLRAIVDRLIGPPPAEVPVGTPPPEPPADRRARSDRIFPDTPLPLAPLRDGDADLHLTIGTYVTGGQTYRAINTHIVLQGGKLTVDPLTGDLPEGHLEGSISVDASQASPPVHIRLRAPGLALRPLLETLRQPPIASGNLEVFADLSGTGASPHAIASTVSGTLGLAVPGGAIDNRLLGSILGQVMNQINALDLVGRGGSTELRCFGARLDMAQGIATVRVLDLSSALATVTGSGTLNLGAETMDLILRPEARIGGATLVIPVRLEGPMRKPVARVNEVRSVTDNAASVAGAVIGSATPLGAIGGLLGANRILGGGSDACPAALAAARGQAAPAEGRGSGGAQPPAPKLPIPNLSDPAKTLRNLFR